MQEFAGRRGVVTGATRGMGLVIARRLATLGTHLAICGRQARDVELAVSELTDLWPDLRTWGVTADMADPQAVGDFADQAIGHLGGLDFIVINAGGTIGPASLEASAQDWLATYSLNTVQLVVLVQRALPFLRQSQSPAVVVLTSISGRLPAPRAQYGASKAATRYVVRALATELAGTRVRINAVAPGSVLTPGGYWDDWRQKHPEDYERFVDTKTPARRLVTPEEVADAVVFLLSSAASGINGAELTVDGGQLAPTLIGWPWQVGTAAHE